MIAYKLHMMIVLWQQHLSLCSFMKPVNDTRDNNDCKEIQYDTAQKY